MTAVPATSLVVLYFTTPDGRLILPWRGWRDCCLPSPGEPLLRIDLSFLLGTYLYSTHSG